MKYYIHPKVFEVVAKRNSTKNPDFFTTEKIDDFDVQQKIWFLMKFCIDFLAFYLKET